MMALLFPLMTWAQGIMVTGKVISGDDGMGLPGVTVTIKGGSGGTVTDIDGRYNIHVDAQGVVVRNFNMMESETIDMSDLPAGVYAVQVLGGKMVTRKIVKN